MRCRGIAAAPLGTPPPIDTLDSDLALPPESADSQTGGETDYWNWLSVRTILPMSLNCTSIEACPKTAFRICG